MSVLMTCWALLCDSACRMNVNVMLRTCGDPEQAPTVTTAASAAAAFQMTVRVRLRMSIACPADAIGVMRLPGFGAENRDAGAPRPPHRTSGGMAWNPTEEETRMAIDPNAVGATTEPMLFEWTDRDTLRYG